MLPDRKSTRVGIIRWAWEVPRAWANVMMISALSGWTLMGISIPARRHPVVISTGCLLAH